MANRRMFSRDLCESDAFLDLPATSQRLYFFLGLFADDEGFLKNPKSVLRQVSGSNDDLRMLVYKGFVIPFDSGVIVITHWKTHNYIQKDRFKPTTCTRERAMLILGSQGEYIKKEPEYALDTACIQPVYSLDTQVRLGKDSIGEVVGDNKCESTPASAAAPESEMQSRIDDCRHAEQLIRHYGLPDNDPTLDAVLEDAEAHGWERLEAALQEAALSNSRQRISVRFYRTILTAEPRKEQVHARADPYANFERF